LANVSLCYQQRFRNLLLRGTFGRSNLCEHIELSDAQTPATKMLSRKLINLLKHMGQTKPGKHG
ncbi:MAG: hypothetical protein JWO42_1695, partial [Chloroflexi bacterium]|nr:hypothetical protein [Chloroflexota bacterium]